MKPAALMTPNPTPPFVAKDERCGKTVAFLHVGCYAAGIKIEICPDVDVKCGAFASPSLSFAEVNNSCH